MYVETVINQIFEDTYNAEKAYSAHSSIKLTEREGLFVAYHSLYMLIMHLNLDVDYAAYKKKQKNNRSEWQFQSDQK